MKKQPTWHTGFISNRR